MSTGEHGREPKQKTQPRKEGAKPVEIPVPKRGEFFANLKKVARAKKRPSR
jgi:hypothetical protein